MDSSTFSISLYSISNNQEFIIAQDNSLFVRKESLIPGVITDLMITLTHTIV